VATTENFTEMLAQDPAILHISCHGLKVKINQGTYIDHEQKDKENCLLFETRTGEGDLISSFNLNKYIK